MNSQQQQLQQNSQLKLHQPFLQDDMQTKGLQQTEINFDSSNKSYQIPYYNALQASQQNIVSPLKTNDFKQPITIQQASVPMIIYPSYYQNTVATTTQQIAKNVQQNLYPVIYTTSTPSICNSRYVYTTPAQYQNNYYNYSSYYQIPKYQCYYQTNQFCAQQSVTDKNQISKSESQSVSSQLLKSESSERSKKFINSVENNSIYFSENQNLNQVLEQKINLNENIEVKAENQDNQLKVKLCNQPQIKNEESVKIENCQDQDYLPENSQNQIKQQVRSNLKQIILSKFLKSKQSCKKATNQDQQSLSLSYNPSVSNKINESSKIKKQLKNFPIENYSYDKNIHFQQIYPNQIDKDQIQHIEKQFLPEVQNNLSPLGSKKLKSPSQYSLKVSESKPQIELLNSITSYQNNQNQTEGQDDTSQTTLINENRNENNQQLQPFKDDNLQYQLNQQAQEGNLKNEIMQIEENDEQNLILQRNSEKKKGKKLNLIKQEINRLQKKLHKILLKELFSKSDNYLKVIEEKIKAQRQRFFKDITLNEFICKFQKYLQVKLGYEQNKFKQCQRIIEKMMTKFTNSQEFLNYVINNQILSSQFIQFIIQPIEKYTNQIDPKDQQEFQDLINNYTKKVFQHITELEYIQI
ncbi:hypothetical protein ABPG72_001391 [Tetrahymena utriculariae]